MGSEERKKIEVSKINGDGRYRIRDIDPHKIAVFKDRYKTGAQFPPIVLDQDLNIISGNHRYQMYMSIDPGCTVKVIIKHYDSVKNRLIDAGTYNQKNGFPLDGFEEKRLAFRLRSAKATENEIEKAVGRPFKIIERWYGQAILVVGEKGQRREEPRKGGVAKSIKEVNDKQYEIIVNRASGWSPVFHADQIILHIGNKTVDLDDEKVAEKLKELRNLLTSALGMNKEGIV